LKTVPSYCIRTKIPVGDELPYEEIKLKDYVSDKPIVFGLLGNGDFLATTTASLSKRVVRCLELMFPKGDNPINHVDILGMVYGGEVPNHAEIYENALEKKSSIDPKWGAMLKTEIYAFVNDFLLRRCLDEKNRLLSIDECCKNLSSITFFTYCYGTQVLNRIAESFAMTLFTYGVNNENIVRIMNSMRQVSYARQENPKFIPTISFSSLQDSSSRFLHLSNSPRFGEMYKKKLGIGVFQNPQGVALDMRIVENPNDWYWPETIDIVSKQLLSGYKQGEGDNEHNITFLDRDKDWDIKERGKKRGDKITKIMRHANSDAMSQMMAWALCRSVENGIRNKSSKEYIPHYTMSELAEELNSIRDAFSEEELLPGK